MHTTKRVLYVRADNSFAFNVMNQDVFHALTTTGLVDPDGAEARTALKATLYTLRRDTDERIAKGEVLTQEETDKINQSISDGMDALKKAYGALQSFIDWEITKRLRGVPESQLLEQRGIATRWANAAAFGGLNETEALQLIHDAYPSGDGVRAEFMEESELERQDFYFRNALECRPHAAGTPPSCVCNMDKARVWHMNQIRAVRNREVAKLDVPYMIAMERANAVEMQRIAAQKKALRDVPQTFDLSSFTTPAELKTAWPSILPPRV